VDFEIVAEETNMKKDLLLLFVFILCCHASARAQWTPQQSGTTLRFRGVSAVNSKVAWASGNGGTVARTVDGGKTWRASVVPGAEALDFRDVEGVDANTAYLLSIGPGEQSRIYKTLDGGASWTLQFTNRNPKAFFDAFAFWDAAHGIAMSDPVDGKFVIITTKDGGLHWQEVASADIPDALEGEAAFAASGTCITVQGKNNVWFGTGGGSVARVFRSSDRGQTWSVSTTPIKAGNASSGIFSLAFKDAMNGIAVGGDYKNEREAHDHVARTNDGGRTWTLLRGSQPSGFRSGVVYVAGKNTVAPMLISVGPSGSDYSVDNGASWTSIAGDGFHAVSFAGAIDAGWAVGEGGRIAKFAGARQRSRAMKR
jgi:photosystem II stability/assembly factor-like uncharacterized protein